MVAIILNSGLGSRMEHLTKDKHKSMVEILPNLSLIQDQLNKLIKANIKDIIITTGYQKEVLEKLILDNYKDKLNIKFYYSNLYKETNYIYSLSLIDNNFKDDVILMHGDLYFTDDILADLINAKTSKVIVDSTLPLPLKDFKGDVTKGYISKIGVDVNTPTALALQPLYKLLNKDYKSWADKISEFVKDGKTKVYAENALNEILDKLKLEGLDVKGRLCMEVDTISDLQLLQSKLQKENKR
jgi:phosphoenolpyruvate phosphomutase